MINTVYSSSRADLQKLFEAQWTRLRFFRTCFPEIECEATPILVFGRWDTAKVATVGINPSEDEFRYSRTHSTRARLPLDGDDQRFIHWEDSHLNEPTVLEAFRRMEGYFALGNAYKKWFDRYHAFLASIGVSFLDGTAAHTDFGSPFATQVGISKVSLACRRTLELEGLSVWRQVLHSMPSLEGMVVHGRGWRAIDSAFGPGEWTSIPGAWDSKGGIKAPRPFLRFREIIDGNKRRLWCVSWMPNRDGSPFCYLSASDQRAVACRIEFEIHSFRQRTQ